MKFLCVSGSLRQASHNTGLLRFAMGVLNDLAPESETKLYIPSQLPLFSSAMDRDSKAYQGVADARKLVSAADGILIASPEYNYSVSGALKNWFDWCSEPYLKSPFAGKKVAGISAAASFVGGARGLSHLNEILMSMMAQPFVHPEVLVGESFKKFDASGELKDEATQEFLSSYLKDFVRWVNA